MPGRLSQDDFGSPQKGASKGDFKNRRKFRSATGQLVDKIAVTNDPDGQQEATHMTQIPEARLMELARNGDRDAMGTLLESYRQRLFNVCLRMVGSRDDAAELTQDAMVKIVQHLNTYNGASAFSTWIIRIAMNLSISHLRKQKLRQAASLEACAPAANGEQSRSLRDRLADHAEPGPAHRVQQRELVEHLYGTLARLDEDLRAVLVLRDIDQMDYQQIASVLDIPVGTVKSRLFRARLALRREMLQVCPPDEGGEMSRGETPD